MEAEEINVIIYSAEGLRGRKKGRHKYSVIFGIGSNKFRTQVVIEANGCPVWNEESTITVDHVSSMLVLTVTEKEDVLGQVTVPLRTIGSASSTNRRTATLQPHKKCPAPHGQISFECSISRYAPPNPSTLSPPSSLVSANQNLGVSTPTINVQGTSDESLSGSGSKRSTLGRLRDNIVSRSPGVSRKLSSSNRNLATPSHANSKHSQSLIDISFLGRRRSTTSIISAGSDDSSAVDTPTAAARDSPAGGFPSGAASVFAALQDVAATLPEVTGVSPREGPVTGGTRLTLRGVNLGVSREDVVGLFVCGANCLASLEYESARKLYCTTKSWRPGAGSIVIETQSGGRGTSLVQYRFMAPMLPETAVEEEDEGARRGVSPAPSPRASPAASPCPSPVMTRKEIGGSKFALNEDDERKEKTSGFKSWLTRHDSDKSNKTVAIPSDRELELLDQIKLLRGEIKDLKDQNSSLKLYIDQILSKVIIECPTILCSNNASIKQQRVYTL